MIIYFIEVHFQGSLFFSTTANNEEHGRTVYQALRDRFDRGQGFEISIFQEERISNFVDSARWE